MLMSPMYAEANSAMSCSDGLWVLKSGWGILKSKWHTYAFPFTPWCDKCRFLDRLLIHRYLMVTFLKIPELRWMQLSPACPAAHWWGAKHMDPELRWMQPSTACPASSSLMRDKENGSRVEMKVAFPSLFSCSLKSGQGNGSRVEMNAAFHSLSSKQLIDEGQGMDPELRWMQPSPACPAAHWWGAKGLDPELRWMQLSPACPAAHWWGARGMDPELRWMQPSTACPASSSLMRDREWIQSWDVQCIWPSPACPAAHWWGPVEWVQSWDECSLSTACPASSLLMRDREWVQRGECSLPQLVQLLIGEEQRAWIQSWDKCSLPQLVQLLINEGQGEWIQSWDECSPPQLVQ